MQLNRITAWLKAKVARAAPDKAQTEILASVKFPCC